MLKEVNEIDCVALAQKVLEAEADALKAMSQRVNSGLAKAVKIILNHKGKVVVTGMGKSGHVAQKIAATLSSTGTQAVYLHPAEAVHGDFGIYHPGDPTIVLSKSGSTAEIVRLLPTLRQLESPVIAILGNVKSPIAEKADVILDASITREADPLGIVPTSSALVSMAMGDALASALMKFRGFAEEDFAQFHPAGQLGKNLLHCVGDVMSRIEKVACVQANQSIREVVQAMTDKPMGGACIIDANGHLEGLITDGDIRRSVLLNTNVSVMTVRELMTRNPISVEPQMLLGEALELMENRPNQISVLPVVENKKLVGLLRIHDIYMH